MILEDEELNFAIPQEPEFRVVRRHRRVHPVQQAADDGILAFLIPATLLVFALLIGSALHPPTPNPPTTQLNEGSSPSQNVQTSQNENQASHPEYFPAGWDYITSPQSTEMYKDNQIYTIPQDSTFFVSLRIVNGFYLAVASDGSWNGWVNITGLERQIPMHPNFAGAKKFAEEVDWNLLASSYSVAAAPSQEEKKTDLEALRAFAVTTERNDMTLIQKNDAQQDRQQTSEVPEITVQGERAFIPAHPEPEQQEKRVKLPKTKWFADSEGTQVPSVPHGWGCDVKNGKQTRCTIQDGNGAILYDFYPGEGCEYDGRQVVCRN